MIESGQDKTNLHPYIILGNPDQRAVLKRRTLDMVTAAKDAGTVIFLDKTARPLSYLYRTANPIFYPERKLPNLRIVNLGSEKTSILNSSFNWNEVLSDEEKDDLSVRLKTREDVEYMFGLENINQLARIIKPNQRPETRIIVDEVEDTGLTMKLAQRLFTIVDPFDQYLPFVLVKSEEDRKPFSRSSWGKSRAYLPWHGNGVISGSESDHRNYASFTLKGIRNSKYGHIFLEDLKSDFDKLAQEIKEESTRSQ